MNLLIMMTRKKMTSYCYIGGIWIFVAIMTILQPLDPAGELQHARDNYELVSYTCKFTKQEVVNGKLMPKEISDVWVLEEPFSVYMVINNPNKIRRALYVENRFMKGDKECIIVEPNGILRLFVASLLVPIDDPIILKNSRNTIRSFGFKAILDKTLKSIAECENVAIIDTGEIDGRSTRVFGHDDGRYLLVLHIDDEWNLPVASYIYDNGLLIGSYKFSNIVLNPGLEEEDFDPKLHNL